MHSQGREALQAATAADREQGYSPLRDPEHPMYNPAQVDNGAPIHWVIVWEDDEPEEDADDGEDSEEACPEPSRRANPRWRTIKDDS